jgi:hypothetical protein
MKRFFCPKCHQSHGGRLPKGIPITSEYCTSCPDSFTVVRLVSTKVVRALKFRLYDRRIQKILF